MVVPFSMLESTTISVKVPRRFLEQLPAPGHGRSEFILKALEEKIVRRETMKWKPKTKRGRRMAALLKKGKAERTPLLSDVQIDQELGARRGRNY